MEKQIVQWRGLRNITNPNNALSHSAVLDPEKKSRLNGLFYPKKFKV